MCEMFLDSRFFNGKLYNFYLSSDGDNDSDDGGASFDKEDFEESESSGESDDYDSDERFATAE